MDYKKSIFRLALLLVILLFSVGSGATERDIHTEHLIFLDSDYLYTYQYISQQSVSKPELFLQGWLKNSSSKWQKFSRYPGVFLPIEPRNVSLDSIKFELILTEELLNNCNSQYILAIFVNSEKSELVDLFIEFMASRYFEYPQGQFRSRFQLLITNSTSLFFRGGKYFDTVLRVGSPPSDLLKLELKSNLVDREPLKTIASKPGSYSNSWLGRFEDSGKSYRIYRFFADDSKSAIKEEEVDYDYINYTWRFITGTDVEVRTVEIPVQENSFKKPESYRDLQRRRPGIR